MTGPQFAILIAVVVVIGLLAVVAIPWSVERAVSFRWKEILAMFDRALAHGGSLDTLSKDIRENSEVSKTMAQEANTRAESAVQSVALLHVRVRNLEEHPFLRPLGGNGHKEGGR
jgi:hypothetical protein